MAGLVNRSIWVWPSWDAENHDGDYVAATIHMGWFPLNRSHDKGDKKGFCMCTKQNESHTQCVTHARTSSGADDMPDEGFPVPPHLCKIQSSILVEEINEVHVPVILEQENWLSANENVILDIDEDYFGCTYVVTPLLEANMTLKSIWTLANEINAMFCPNTLAEEKGSNIVLQDLLKIVHDTKACQVKKRMQNITECKAYSDMEIQHTFLKSVSNFRNDNLIRLCPNTDKQLISFAHEMTSYLIKRNMHQIEALQAVGFCAQTSPRNRPMFDERRFGLCIGANTPDNTAVLIHQPSLKEITHRSILLNQILQHLRPFSPKLVTLCRSVRDGYTPRKNFEQIEKNILNGLNKTFSTNMHVNYDSGLLGGKTGWLNRNLNVKR